MATLYVENVPDDLYQALREQAKAQHRSMAAEVLALLSQNVPTRKELKAREEFLKKVRRMQLKKLPVESFIAAEDLIREDRER
jgi:plasmid stability protein